MDMERVLRLGVRLLPADRAEWGRALVAELDAVPPAARSRWAAGGALFVLRELVLRPGLYLLGLGGAVAVLVWVDRSPSDIANQASLLVLLLGAGLLGVIKPRWAWLAGLGVGSSLAAAHALYLATGHRLPYAMSPSGWAGPITLLVLLVPAFLAAYAGAGAGLLVRRQVRPR